MPVMDGYELVRQMRLDPATRQIPVLFYTAHYGEREARSLALTNGVADVLTKPSDSKEVLRVVDSVLSGKKNTSTVRSGLPRDAAFDREHLRLVTDKLSEKVGDLRVANGRLRALINIGLELASEKDQKHLLQKACEAARDLFGATYVTLGIVEEKDRTLKDLFGHGTDSLDWIRAGYAVPGILAKVVEERRVMRGDNPDGNPAKIRLSAGHPEIQSFLAVPVASPSRVYGWFCLVRNEGIPFTDEDENLVAALSGQIGRIYESVLLEALSRSRAAELEVQIAGRQRVEADLGRERDRSQRYLDAAAIILLALDTEGRVTLVNRYGSSLLGWTSEELVGRNFIETCLPPREHALSNQRFREVIAGDLTLVVKPVITRSGEERLIEWRNTILRDDSGSVIGTLSSGTDITDRDRAAEALRTAEERMRFALESAAVGIWDIDYAAGVLRWSPILEAQFGLEPGTFAGTFEAFVERVHPDDREIVLDAMSHAMRSGTDFSVQFRAIWTNGTVRRLSGSGRIHLGENGEPVRGVGISLDVTERRNLEEQFQQAQKMEAIGRLAAGVAHDFNNLLTVILGNCELLLGDLTPDHPSQPDVSEIQKAAVRATDLTRQLLSFSRKQTIEPKRLDLNAVVTEMHAMLRRLLAGVEIVLRTGSELDPVTADPGQIEQVVMNLAVNARDAMSGGGILTIETANVVLDERYAKTHLGVPPGPYVMLRVADTGCGMTAEVQTRLFEPFFTTKEVGKGTGLGLATVHGIVRRSGGSIRVSSEEGVGTEFAIYLPRAPLTEASAAAVVPVLSPATGVETVLVMDDARERRELTRRLLERQGYTVHVAADEEEALRAFELHPGIEVLLTDIVMTGPSGPAFTRRLTSRRPALKVIYVSGYTEAEEALVHRAPLDSRVGFLHKPFTSEILGRTVREVLDRPKSTTEADESLTIH